MAEVKQRYTELRQTVNQYETRAERYSILTIPAVFPKDGYSDSQKMEDSLSHSLGAMAVNSLSAKIVNSLMPSASIPFKLDPDSQAMEMLTDGDSKLREEINKMTSTQSVRINKEMEAQDMRTPLYDIVGYLQIVGSCVIEKVVGKGIRYHGLRSFGVSLDDSGNPLEIGLMEEISPRNIPEGLDIGEVDDINDTVKLYTLYQLEDSTWTMRQEINDKLIDERTYTDETLPVQYVGWSFNKGDTYHRPYCEQWRGDLNAYNQLSRVLNDGSVIASKSLLFVNPMGVTKKVHVANSLNGDVLDGRMDDVTSFQLDKNFDFKIPMERLSQLKDILSRAFLMNSSSTRDAERVTAQEVAYMARELESTLSGIYSKFATSITKRLVTWVMNELNIKFDTIDVNIITGLNALGKTAESQKLDGLIQRIVQLNAQNRLNAAEVINRYALYEGVDPTGLFKTDSEVAQEQKASQEQMQEQTMMQEGAASLGRTAGEGAGQKMTQE